MKLVYMYVNETCQVTFRFCQKHTYSKEVKINRCTQFNVCVSVFQLQSKLSSSSRSIPFQVERVNCQDANCKVKSAVKKKSAVLK